MPSAFSFTAPQFTEEEEKVQKESLSEEDKRIIEDDVYGRRQIIESDYQRESSPALVQAALHAIRDEDKQDYLAALDACPNLVATESDALRFMRADNYNAKAAAIRLCKYWTARRAIFQEKAFEPMTLAGAMSNDHLFIRTKHDHAACLPKDAHGRIWMFSQRDGSDIPQFGRLAIVRAFWYHAHCALEDEDFQLTGSVMMANMDFFKALGQFDRIQMKYLIKPICEALPIAIRAGHTCVGSRFSGLIARMTLFFVPSEIRLRNHVHTEQKGISLVNKLREYGMDELSIPVSMGGTFKFDGEAFFQSRLAIELARSQSGRGDVL